MPTNPAYEHYAILTAMLAPAFFLTATASLIMSANSRLARVIDRLRSILKELEDTSDPEYRGVLERRIQIQRHRSRLVLRGSQLLYLAISCFVGTSLSVAADAFIGYRFVTLPTITAVLGVLSLFAASLYLARESMLAVKVIDEEMDHRYATARMRKREQQVDRAEGEDSG
jgi:hypothetical protein